MEGLASLGSKSAQRAKKPKSVEAGVATQLKRDLANCLVVPSVAPTLMSCARALIKSRGFDMHRRACSPLCLAACRSTGEAFKYIIENCDVMAWMQQGLATVAESAPKCRERATCQHRC